MQRRPKQADDYLNRLAASSNAALAEMARGKLSAIAANRKPVDLKFVAVDGREVDLAKLRGKVVIADFGATWCRPCIAELPNIKKVYADYHARGFEIVGIALENARLAPTDTAD